MGAVQASDSYVSELVTCYPSCLTWLISDRSGRHREVWVGWAAEFMSRSSVSTSRMVDWVDECYVYGWHVICMLGSRRRRVVSLLPVLGCAFGACSDSFIEMWVDILTVYMAMLSLFLDPWDTAQWVVTCGNVKRVAAEYDVGGVPKLFGLMQMLQGLLYTRTTAAELLRMLHFIQFFTFRYGMPVFYWEDLLLFFEGLVCVLEHDNGETGIATAQSRSSRRIWWMLHKCIQFHFTEDDFDAEDPDRLGNWAVADVEVHLCFRYREAMQKICLLMMWHPYLSAIHADIIYNFRYKMLDDLY